MQKIPKIIHYCWVGKAPKPESVQYCINSWKKYCPDYKIIEWNEENYDFSKNQYMKEAYESKKWGFVPDYARLDIIYNYGGIYFDTDVELVSNIDMLLENDAFMGFENTGDGEIFVNCGHGFGASKGNEIIKKERDEYENVHFINKDGTLNMLPSPHYTTKVLCEYGLIRKNTDQNINNIKIFASDVLCPKNFRTGKIHKTKRTLSIHHFTASWLDEKIKKELLHEQKIKHICGNYIGSKYFYIESVFKKYGIINLPIQLVKKGYQKLCFFKLQFDYIKYLKLTKIVKDGTNNFILLDTCMDGDNAGDNIIMENCLEQLNTTMNVNDFLHIPTHRYINKKEKKQLFHSKGKILCGTNILSGNMRNYGLWKLTPNIMPYKNTILMGIGFDSINDSYDSYTKEMLQTILSKKYLHSVRDSYSENKLKSMGINNVINTGCPTMWGLTADHCNSIPISKTNKVVCTITDYCRDYENDQLMLDILVKNYEKVYLWLQGIEDEEYIKELNISSKIEIIPRTILAYDSVLKQKNLDYVGTRLHAGIRALSFKHRTIIISIDSRSKNISIDTNLPIIDRHDLKDKLEPMINSNFRTSIVLNIDNIEKWKMQFMI